MCQGMTSWCVITGSWRLCMGIRSIPLQWEAGGRCWTKNMKHRQFFYFTPVYTLPRGNLSASAWLLEGGVACTSKSWWEKERNFLPTKNSLLEACDNLPKTNQQDAAVGVPQATLCRPLKQRVTVKAASDETEHECTQRKRFKPPAASGLITSDHVTPLVREKKIQEIP